MTAQEPYVDPLHFKISSALKRVIGRDLITDEFVAIFELVKNGYDARATRVDIVLAENRLYILDNGKGMSLQDIIDKWLFVAYSAKRDGTEDRDYRDLIGNGKAFAGSKGVGRFSCDRLGQILRMQTRCAGTKDVEVVTVNWERFERNAKEEFAAVPLQHETSEGFELPDDIDALASGTVLEISVLREDWDRTKLLKLRAALAKLINPFGNASDDFQVWLHVPGEADADAGELARPDAGAAQTSVVNGPIENFIFDTLKGKTTHLEVTASDDGAYLISTLTDRGELVYRVREPNADYPLLAGADFNCNLFYLNRSAKMTFKRRMGVNSVEFGSVFLFKNGFRIFPIGEDGVDTFGIDRRKAQGYNRFLGTRDVIGRIDVSGSDDVFRESTSRDQGLIQTPAYEQLEDCFDEKCFRRLERYVVGVNWKDALDFDVEDASRLRGDSASARVTAIVAQLAGTAGVELLDYNQDIVRILNERSDAFSDTLSSLKVLANKSRDDALLQEIEAAAARFADLQRAEISARSAADRERIARREAERAAGEAVLRAEVATKSLDEERKRNLFLTSLGSLDRDIVEILHHQIIIHAAAINEIVNTQFDKLRDGTMPTREDLISAFENISFQNRKVLSTARFATKANFRLDSETIDEDLAGYVIDYINQVAPVFSETGIRILVTSEAKGLHRRFKPIEVSILIDNLVSNAGRADASEISFHLDQSSPSELRLVVEDDGNGFDPSIAELDRLFEKGFTTSTGSGLGLYHVAQILDDLGGAINAEFKENGARFVIRIRG